MKKRELRRLIAARATIAFIWFLALIPLPVARLIAVGLGRVAYFVVPRIRRIGLGNMDLVYGDTLTRGEKIRRLKRSVDNVGIIAAEFPRIAKLRGRFLDRHVTVKGLERLPRDRGAVLISAHLANWEWLAPVMASHGYKAAEVVRTPPDTALSAFVDRTRRSNGIITIPRDDAARDAVRLLRQGWHVGILIDQSPRHNAAPTTFLGRQCWSTVGPVVLARMAGSPIFGVSITRGKRGRYVLEVLPEVELVEGKLTNTVAENCQRCQNVISEIVAKNPDQWLWVHKRWKRRPRLERQWQQRAGKQQVRPPVSAANVTREPRECKGTQKA